MNLSLFAPSDTPDVIELFTNVFSESENADEGSLIGSLVTDLIETTPPEDLVGFVARDGAQLAGCIFFSRFIVPDESVAFILSPVAISTSLQGTGIGQRLIRYGLSHLQALEVGLVFTYGDPSFYSKSDFRQIDEHIVQAPFALSQPHGWMAQSLDGSPVNAMPGPTQCAAALSDQKYW